MTDKPTYDELQQNILELEKHLKEVEDLKNQLKESRALNHALFYRIRDCVFICDPSGNFLDANQAALDLLEYQRQEIKNLNFATLVNPEDLPFVYERTIDTLEKGYQPELVELELKKKGGGKVTVESVSSVIYKDDKPAGMLGIARDISTRKKNEIALHESEERHRLITEYATDIIWVRETDEDYRVGPITFISPSVERLRGFTVEEAIALPLDKSMPRESLEIAAKALYEELARNYHEKTDLNRSRTIEVELFCKDGTLKWFEITIRIIRNTKGKPLHILGISRDISERRNLQKQALESAKMAALGGLVAGVAHEISTPIGVSITASTYMNDLVEKLDRIITLGETDGEKSQHVMNIIKDTSAIIHRNLQHAVEIISSFKQVAVDQSNEGWRPINLKNTLEEILVNLEPRLKQTRHKISVNCSEKHIIHSSPSAFFQIITNLIMNSLIHGFETIETGNILIDISDKGSHLLFLFSDDGCGMESHVLERIFDPFFTTKRGQGGTGLGLHIVYNLVTQTLGGTIRCQSKPGKGADFYITIPLHDKTEVQDEPIFHQ